LWGQYPLLEACIIIDLIRVVVFFNKKFMSKSMNHRRERMYNNDNENVEEYML
jgi:hypothetical protein